MNTSGNPHDQEFGSELTEGETKVRKRPRPGERRLQILQILAEMLQNPRGERVTTCIGCEDRCIRSRFVPAFCK
jgi:TetR/AcrR family transcriptional regulator